MPELRSTDVHPVGASGNTCIAYGKFPGISVEVGVKSYQPDSYEDFVLAYSD